MYDLSLWAPHYAAWGPPTWTQNPQFIESLVANGMPCVPGGEYNRSIIPKLVEDVVFHEALDAVVIEECVARLARAIDRMGLPALRALVALGDLRAVIEVMW